MVVIKNNLIKNFGLLAFFLFCITACKDFHLKSKTSETSVLVIEPSHLDLGSIKEEQSTMRKVSVINRSSNPIIIEKLSATCGCTSAKLSSKVIKPLGRATLNVEISPQGRRGTFGSTVNITWSEMVPSGTSGNTKATFQANGLYIASLTPSIIEFGTVNSNDNPSVQTLSLLRGTQNVKFVEVKASKDMSGIETIVEKINNDKWKIAVKLAAKDLPTGSLNSQVLLLYLNAAGDTLHQQKILVRARIEGPVSLKPKSLFFGTVQAGTVKEGVITLNSSADKSAEIESVQLFPEEKILNLKTIQFPQNPSKSELHYSLQTEGKSGNHSGRILVKFKEKNLGEASIPFILYIKD